jgi:beta-N-acetylhexosaminidase
VPGVRARVAGIAAATLAVSAVGCGAEEETGPLLVGAAANPTLAQLVGQRFVFALDGTRIPAGLQNRIRSGEAAGVIIFGRNSHSAAGLRRLTSRLQSIPRPPGMEMPLLVMTDQEGGQTNHVPGPPTKSAPATRTAAQAQQQGRAAANNLRGLGINVDLAPVTDVARGGSAIGKEKRSYGRTPDRVTPLATAFLRGLAAGRVAGTAKHFPGFGAARVNTDLRPVTIRLTRAQLDRTDLPPFTAMVKAHVPLVMLSTAIYIALDSKPAALSKPIATDLLRDTIGFKGVTISDDLDAPSLNGLGGVGARGIAAATAGTDLLLFAKSYENGNAAADALLARARTSKSLRDSLRDPFLRVLSLRRSLAPPGG